MQLPKVCRRKRGKTYISKNTKDARRKQGVRKVRIELEGWTARKSKHFKEEQQCTKHQMSQRNMWKREPLLQEASDESSTLQSSCCGEGQEQQFDGSMVVPTRLRQEEAEFWMETEKGVTWPSKAEGNEPGPQRGWFYLCNRKESEINYRRIISSLWWDNFQPLKMIQGWWSCL